MKGRRFAIDAKQEWMNRFVRPGWYLIDYRNNERAATWRAHRVAFRAPAKSGGVRELLIRFHTLTCAFFLLQRTGRLVNEREMDVWIKAVMAPFLLILPLLASLRHLIQPIGKWGSSLQCPLFAGKCERRSEKKKRELQFPTASRERARVVYLESRSTRYRGLSVRAVRSTWDDN